MKHWHRIRAWMLLKKAEREQRKLAHFIELTAQEIHAWRTDIGFIEEEVVHHRRLAGIRPLVGAVKEPGKKLVLLQREAA